MEAPMEASKEPTSRLRTLLSRPALFLLGLALGLGAPSPATAASFDGPLLIEGATIGAEHIWFSNAGRLWRVPLAGGEATVVTDGSAGEDTHPYLSPDGSRLAFARQAGGEEDVYALELDGSGEVVAGTEPLRLTWHPKADRPRGWTPDGSAVLFATDRDGDGTTRLYTVALPTAAGGEPSFPTALPLPEGTHGAFSPDGGRLAYSPHSVGLEGSHYRHYRGGQTAPLWVATLADSEVRELAPPTANHVYPLWAGEALYFLADPTGAFDLYRRDPDGATRPLTRFHRHGIRHLAGGFGGARPPRLVFVRGGRLHRVETEGDQVHPVPVTLDLPAGERSPKTVTLEGGFDAPSLAPDGALYAAARGEIVRFDLGAPGGEAANGEGPTREALQGTALTDSSDAADREPAVSPDGRRLAYLSDRSGEYQLVLRDIASGEERALPIEDDPTFYEQLVWSPDGRRLAFTGQRLGLWVARLYGEEGGTVEKITRAEDLSQETYNPAWSPDSRYLAYDQGDARHLRSVYLHDLETGTTHRVSGQLHAEQPAFDGNGRHLHFLASPLAPLGSANRVWGLLSAQMAAPLITTQVHTALLREGEPDPYLPFGRGLRPGADPTVPAADGFRIDLDGLAERVIALPVPEGVYRDLLPGAPGTFYLVQERWPETPGAGRPSSALVRVHLGAAPEIAEIAEGVEGVTVSREGPADQATLVWSHDGALHRWSDPGPDPGPEGEGAEEDGAPETTAPGPEALSLAVSLEVDPAAEWAQMHREAWRLMRDYFYDPGHHGQDLAALEAHYGEYLPGITRRADLNHLLREGLGHISISHMSIGGGDAPRSEIPPERIGVLGADLSPADGRYRIDTIYRRGRAGTWSSLIAAAPLDQPGQGIEEGDYLLAVAGEPVEASRNVHSYFVGTAYRPVEITVGPDPDGTGARTHTVVPVGGANTIRRAHWFEENRQRVAELSGGRIGYVVAMNYGPGAIAEFIAQLAAQGDKDGWVIDQRFGLGGITSDSLVQLLEARPLHRYAFPYGEDLTVPTLLPRGPKVVLINEVDVSASETFPLMVKLSGAATLVGRRTYGGGTGGAMAYPRLLDGGRVTIPNRASYDPEDGTWAENRGVAPDVDIPWWPADWRRGRDPQLERAVEIALEQAAEASPPAVRRPEYPVHPEGVVDGTP